MYRDASGSRSKPSPAVCFASPPTHWLDWCSGKGHLGRRLLQTGQQLTCLEYDPALVASGQALSQRHHLHACMSSRMCSRRMRLRY
jgi:hypothetical protein